MEQEQQLIEHFGRENQFRVPDGYFEHLTEQVMSRLPDQQPVVKKDMPRRMAWLRPLAAAAAVAAVAVTGAVVWSHYSERKAMEQEASLVQVQQQDYVDKVADYAMVDNEDIYAYLAEE